MSARSSRASRVFCTTPTQTGKFSFSTFSPLILFSPANAEAAALYRDNMKEYIRRVKVTVEESWLDPQEEASVKEENQEAAAPAAIASA